VTKFIFVRHGESEANKAKRIGELGTKLTEAGMEQALETGKALKGQSIDIIVCSEFLRAQQTAEIIAGELGIPIANIKIIPELNERRMGKYEGSLKDHEPVWYYTAEGPEFEPGPKLLNRMHRAIAAIKDLSEKGKVLAVGHAGSGFYLQQAAKNIKDVKDFPASVQMGNAAIMEIEI